MSSPVMLELKIVCSACISMISISGDPYLSISIFLFLNGDTIAFWAHYPPQHIKPDTNSPFDWKNRFKSFYLLPLQNHGNQTYSTYQNIISGEVRHTTSERPGQEPDRKNCTRAGIPQSGCSERSGRVLASLAHLGVFCKPYCKSAKDQWLAAYSASSALRR